MFVAALALGACALRVAPGVDADAREIADAVMEKMHPHHKELDAEIEQGLDEIAVNEPAGWRGHDVVQMQTQTQTAVPEQEVAAREIAAAVVNPPAPGAQAAVSRGLDEIAVNEPESWRRSESILSQIPDEPDASKKVYYTLSGEPLPGSQNATAQSSQGPWGEQIGCPHCGDTTGSCDCNDHAGVDHEEHEEHEDHEENAKPAEKAAAQPAAAFLKSKDATRKQHPA
jgi:hypothetical protein